MVAVSELGYMGLSVTDLEAWRFLVCDVAGLQAAQGDDGLFLRMDYWHHRIALHPGESDDLAYLGWRVAGPVELDLMAQQFAGAGVPCRRGTDEEARQRRVLGLLVTHDPAGTRTEIFYGPQVDGHRPFHPGRPMHGRFVTGGQGLGHAILIQQDVAAADAFYRLLGLEGSVEYRIALPNGHEGELTFLHGNARQHTVAYMAAPSPLRINHLMLEYTSLKDLGHAYDLVRKHALPVALQLGMHANDEALSFYVGNPSGWLLELGWGGRSPSGQQEHHISDVFGHATEVGGYGIDHQMTLL